MISLFDAYLEIFETMIAVEPKLFKDAVKTVKSTKDFTFNHNKMK